MTEMNQSFEARFHRSIKKLDWASKRAQGELMGAFREIVPKNVSEMGNEFHKQTLLIQTLQNELTNVGAKLELSDAMRETLRLTVVRTEAERDALSTELLVAKGCQQSRSRSLAETLCSTTLGFFGSLGITMGSLAAIDDKALAALVATVGCTVWSIARGYTIRRYFESLR